MGHPVIADSKNGKIIRIRPVHFDEKQDWDSLNPWTIEARGKSFTVPRKSSPAPFCLSYKQSIYGPDRVRYPLKRVDWDPSGDRNTQNRGKSKYKRISWDEAYEILASEVKRIHDEYGPYGILCQMDGHGESKNFAERHGPMSTLCTYMGGYTGLNRNPDSWEGWVWGAKHVWGQETVGKMANHTNVWVDALRNTEMILNWGCDGETTPWGGGGIEMNSQLMYWTTEAGIENVFVCPDLNYSANIHADKWIPVLPNTDTALLAALSYVWISEDTYDKDFVENDKYCVGFDKWKAYVMGDEDGVAKTPEWASSKCGVPEWTIKALARNWATHTTSEAMGNGGSFIRGPYCSEPARMMVYSLAMQGLGNPGVYQLSYIEVGASGLPGATSVATSTFSDFGGGPITNPRGGVGSMGATQAQFVVKPLYADSIWATHDNPISWYCKDHCTREEQFVKYTYPVSEDYPRFHMIWMSSCCITVCWQGGFKHTNALRDPSIEIIVGQHMTLENDLQFCDIILPEVRKLECDDLMSDSGGGHFSYIVKETKACEPVGEAKTNFQIVYGLAKKLEEYGGKYKNLANTFCAGYPDDEEAMRHAVDNMPDEYKAYCDPDYLWDNHFYTIPGNPNWEDRGFEGGFYKFRADPESNPLETQTGKIEFECQDIKEHMPDDEERPPVAHYIAGADGWTHNESKEGSRASDYPLLIVSNHPRWREHAQMNSNVWLREIKWCKMRGPDGYMYEPVWINPQDADSRGIKTGDLVKIFNDRGVVLSVAHVNERIIPGAVWQDHGAPIDIIREAAFEPDTKTVDPPDIPSGEFTQLGIDRSGSNNLISPLVGVSQNCTGGMATSGYLVQLERLSLDEMDQWKKTYPDVFDRDYDYDGGLRFEAYLADDEGGTD